MSPRAPNELPFHACLLDSLAASVAVVDSKGTVLYVNPAWVLFGEQNGAAKGFSWEGVNYLEACDGDAAGTDAIATAAGIRSVLAEETFDFSYDYPCHGPGVLRWFTLRVVPVRSAKGQFLITHTDISPSMQAAHHDVLTGLPNRRLLMDRLQQNQRLARRSGTYLAVLFLDLDRFKVLNDTAGHAAGDTLLQLVGQRLLSCVREVDTVARYGGDEFVIVLADLGHQLQHALRHLDLVAGRILELLNRPYDLGALLHRTSSSVGMVLFRGCESVERVLREADSALYQAKRAGRGMARLSTVNPL